MHEKPVPEKKIEDMTIEQLETQIERTSQELDALLSNPDQEQLERDKKVAIPRKFNERAEYVMRRQKQLQKGSEEA